MELCWAGTLDRHSRTDTDSIHTSPPKREVRAVWIATVAGLDWPKSTDISEQKQSLREMIEKLSKARFNTIFFQVRGRGDAMYQSHYEPWSHQLTGRLGRDPGWDPLAFAVDEAHARGMELHAWFNTFLVKTGRDKPPASDPEHIVLRKPDWVRLVENEWWLDPGLPAVREYLIKVVMDLVRHYDVDGIHFDFIRYPGRQFPDDQVYRQYGRGNSREDWRRENINTFVRTVYDSVNRAKPMMKIGSTPIGIYTTVGKINGQQSYFDLFQDSRRWLQEKKQDYLVPQVYWPLGSKDGDPDFEIITRDWAKYGFGRHMYIGIGAYKPEVYSQLSLLIDITRSSDVEGHSFFRYNNIENDLGTERIYQYQANIPPMRWKDSIPPNPPEGLIVSHVDGGMYKLEWKPPKPALDGDRVKYFNIYRSESQPIEIDNPENILFITPDARTSYIDTITHPRRVKYFYAVTAFDKMHNESNPMTERIVIPEIVEMARKMELRFALSDPYPQPASSIVMIPYEIKETSPVVLKILDDANNEVVDVVDEVQKPGRHIAAASIAQLKDGAYHCLFITKNSSMKKKFTVNN